jgi:hypothetical protein
MNNIILNVTVKANHQNVQDPKDLASGISPVDDVAPGIKYNVGVTSPFSSIEPKNTVFRHFHLSVMKPVNGFTTTFNSNRKVNKSPTTNGE